MIWLLLTAVAFCFAASLVSGAPPVAIHRRALAKALDLAELKPGELLIDLGCGYGGLLIAAAQRGARATGYEINPIVWLIAWVRTRRYRHLVSVRLGDFWTASIAEAQVVFVFLLDRHMLRLESKLKRECRPGARVVSYAFELPGRKVSQQTDLLFRYDF